MNARHWFVPGLLLCLALLAGHHPVYTEGLRGLSDTPDWTTEADQASSWYGWAVATAGDVNGDGYDDVIVGAPFFDNGQTDEGRAYVYHGSAAGLSATPDWIAEDNVVGSWIGWAVGTAGDVNGDGYDDVVIGANTYSNGQATEGKAVAYYGSASGLSLTPDWIVESNQAGAEMGYGVNTAGDVNGDGYDDVLVGAWKYDNGETNEGAAFLYFGSSAGLSTTAAWVGEGNQVNTNAQFGSYGTGVGTAGDVNNDGYDDIIVSAPLYDNGQTDEGRAFVYHGSSTGPGTVADWTAESDQAAAHFSETFVYSAGDVNGDGYDDVVIGSHAYNNPENDEGRAFVWFGSASGLGTNGLPGNADWSAESNQNGANFGFWEGPAGDVNGDGYADIIIGAPTFDGDQADEGHAFVYSGSATGPSASAYWTGESNQTNSWYGIVFTAGDVNGDGFDDVIVGAYQYDNGQNNEGAAFVYHGSADFFKRSSVPPIPPIR